MNRKNDNYTKAKNIVKQKLDKQKDWLDKAKNIHNIVPYIQQSFKQTQWQYGFFETMPYELQTKIDEAYINKLYESKKFIDENLPSLPAVSTSTAATLSAISVTDTTATLDIAFINRWGISEENKLWAGEKINEHRKLQESQKVKDFVQLQLKNLDKNIAEEFEEAIKAYYALSTTSDITGTANKVRNVIEHIKGRLFKKAIRPPKEQKIKKWNIMAERLTKGAPNGIEAQKLMDEGDKYNELHNKLSRICKNLDIITIEDFENIVTKVIDHLFAVLNLIDERFLNT